MRRRTLGIVVVALAVVGSLAFPLVYGGGDAVLALAQFPVDGFAVIALAAIASALAKAVKFRLLAGQLRQRLSLGGSLAVSLGCDFAYLATPAGLGGYPASVFLLGRAGIAPARGAAIAAADQVLDLVFFAAAVPAAALWMLGAQLSLPAVDLVRLAAVSFAVVPAAWLVWRFGRRPLAAAANALRRLPFLRRRSEAIARWCRELCLHLRELRAAGPVPAAALLLATAAQWIARYAILGLVLDCMAHPVPLAAALLIQSVALHAGQWTGAPGGVGGADLLVAQAIGAWAPASAIAAAILIWRIATFHATLVTGGIAFGLLALRGARGAGTGPLRTVES